MPVPQELWEISNSPGCRNRGFLRNTAFEPLTLVKNPVYLVFMRNS